MTVHHPSRRALLGAGLSVSFLGAPALAQAGRTPLLVVVVCRGGMDGLSVAPPVGDSAYAGLRRGIAIPAEAALKLDGTFGLHPALAGIHGLAAKGQARIAPAIASPDRARSHFEAQDVLESGATSVYGAGSGWLNRTVSAVSASRPVKALSVGATAPLILRGPAPASSWSPGRIAESSPRLPALLSELYTDDALLGPAFARGLETEGMAKVATAGMAPPGAGQPLLRQGQQAAKGLGKSLAGFMTQPGGPQIAAVSADGFDTHANQGAAQGQLAARLLFLDALVMGVQEGLGPAWTDTIVVCVTEFGRTARVNGTNGTDHGTGSTAILAGGALKPGGIVGDWPTLAENALFEGRDLRPTVDTRSLFKGLLRDHLGIDRAALERDVFPDSATAAAIGGLV